MAAELKYLNPQIKVTLVHSRDKLLSAEPLPDELKDKSLELVLDAGVETLMSHRLDKTEETLDADGNKCHKITFTNGHTMLADQVVMAVSHGVPATSFIPSDALNDEGYVRIQPTLEFPADTPNATHHFAVGDLVQWSGIKRCGGAMHMGFYAANNIHVRMVEERGVVMPEVEEPEVVLKLEEIPPMIGLAVGGKAVAYWPEAGVTAGDDILKGFFGEDLGFTSKFLGSGYCDECDLLTMGLNSLLESYEAWVIGWGEDCCRLMGIGGLVIGVLESGGVLGLCTG